MEYNLRKVNATDLFLVTTIISLIGIRELKDCLRGEETMELIKDFSKDKENKDAALSAVGASVVFDIVGVVFGNLEKCRDKVFLLLSNLSGMKVKEIAELEATTFMEMLIEVIKENSKDFIGVASKLFNLAK
ncbi:hypothetical protein ACQQ4G_003143 [Listeria monocytogenes]